MAIFKRSESLTVWFVFILLTVTQYVQAHTLDFGSCACSCRDVCRTLAFLWTCFFINI